ncbi:hypothetical protein WJX82_004444 [Trebouxia sp. C0006]
MGGHKQLWYRLEGVVHVHRLGGVDAVVGLCITVAGIAMRRDADVSSAQQRADTSELAVLCAWVTGFSGLSDAA